MKLVRLVDDIKCNAFLCFEAALFSIQLLLL